jgi:dolichol-phosphate mannosyltransferase
MIFIDDGSKDNSYSEMLQVKELDKERVRLIRFSRNFGQVAAIYAGYEAAKGKAMVNIAADLQEPKELLIEIIGSYLSRDASIIAGQRMDRNESLYRKGTSKIFYYMMKQLNFPDMPGGGFDTVLISEEVKKIILGMNESNPFWQGQLLWTGMPVKFIPYVRKSRETGVSRWNFSKKMKYLLDGVLNYSYAPLRFFSLVGIVSFLLGIVYAMVIVINYFGGGTPFKGWAPIMIVVLLFSGMQLVMLGLMGEYLWRTLEQTKNRPKYIVKDTIN